MATVFHPLKVHAVEPLTDDSAAVTFDVPDDLRELFDFEPGESLTLRRVVDGVEHRRTYSICAPAGDAPRIGVREIPDGMFSSWLIHQVAPGETVEVAEPSGSFRADPSSSVTMLYGNRETTSVMFAEELGDLKNLHGPRFDLVHVLSREPRDVVLFSGSLDADKLRRTTLFTLFRRC